MHDQLCTSTHDTALGLSSDQPTPLCIGPVRRSMASSGASKVPHATDTQSALVEIVSDAAHRLKAQRSLASWGKLAGMVSNKYTCEGEDYATK